jgi:hypothetical protein
MLALDVDTSQIAEIYSRFASVVGERHWCNRVQQCKQAIKGNVFLREHLTRENDIAFQLDRLGKLAQRFGRIPLAEADNSALYPAVSLAAQALSLMDATTKEHAERFRRRIHGALRNPADMRGLRLELTAATHFARRGRRISWPETTGLATFDLLVEGAGHEPLEVECKSIGEDKGRRIRRQEVIEFVALLSPHLRSTTAGLGKGLSVVLTLPDRLPSMHKDRVELAKALGRAIFAGFDCNLSNGSDVRITEFDASQLGDAPLVPHRELRATLDAISGTDNRSAVVIGTQAGGTLALTIQSQCDDALITAVFKTLSDAAKRQLTGSRAGMLFTGFDGLDGEQLLSVAAQDQDPSMLPTALRMAVSQFLSSNTRDHVIGVGFVSRSALLPVKNGLIESGGTAYYFPKRESAFWSDGFSGMFEWTAGPTGV